VPSYLISYISATTYNYALGFQEMLLRTLANGLYVFSTGILPQKLMLNFSTTEFQEHVEPVTHPRPPAVAPTLPTPPSASPPPLGAGGSSPIIVRAEEALIVLLVLVLWIAAIALFFNRWGKIRMLEPYQPKFQQQHRPSCPMVDINGPIGLQVLSCWARLRRQLRASKAETRAVPFRIDILRCCEHGAWVFPLHI
jgi:hypothetical protein